MSPDARILPSGLNATPVTLAVWIFTEGENHPSKGGVETLAGRPLECGTCHDHSAIHIDGIARTFDCNDDCDPDEYRTGYRLHLVNGANPMEIPWTWWCGFLKNARYWSYQAIPLVQDLPPRSESLTGT